MGAYELLKDAARAAQKADNIALYGQIMDVQQAVLDLQEKQQQLQSRINSLTEENNALVKRAERNEGYVAGRGVYWLKEDVERQQPYCPVCFSKGNDIMLQPVEGWQVGRNTEWHCKNCNDLYNPWDHKDSAYIPPRRTGVPEDRF